MPDTWPLLTKRLHSADGKFIATAAETNRVTAFDAHTGLIQSFKSAEESSFLASGSTEGTVLVWDIITDTLNDLLDTDHDDNDFDIDPDIYYLAFSSTNPHY
ncbi:hypothetical protein N7490_007841 [Penicillium lividum]|nr:hypothetical protein N7490_007841 [Penicillium lividum]